MPILRLRLTIILGLGILAMLASAVACVMSFSIQERTSFESTLAAAAFLEFFSSFLVFFLACLMAKRSTEPTRSFALAGGLGMQCVASSIFVAPVLSQMMSNPGSGLSTRLLAIGTLTVVAWMSGVVMTLELFVTSVKAGDWARTIWTRKHSKPGS